MKLPDTRIILFNVAGALVTFGVLVAVLRSFVFAPSVAPCTERYPAGTIFGLERGGVLLTSADLQARLGGKDVGLGDNVEIARVKGGPAPVAMGVHLAKGSASPHAPAATKGGVSFPWEPRAIQGKSAACLAYSVLLPADFDFHRGGVLPGMQGAEPSGESQDGFTAQLAWRRNGRGAVNDRATVGNDKHWGGSETESFTLPAGRWVKLEQEMVLNAPKQADGIMRVWVDGKLVVDRGDMIYRGRPEVTVTGVGADVFYGGDDAAGGAPKDATIWLSPFEMRWQ
jgi:hypothetical protein